MDGWMDGWTVKGTELWIGWIGRKEGSGQAGEGGGGLPRITRYIKGECGSPPPAPLGGSDLDQAISLPLLKAAQRNSLPTSQQAKNKRNKGKKRARKGR